MRKVLLGGVFLVLATAAASAQPWPGYGYGYGYRPPPPPPVYGAYGGYGGYGGYYGPPRGYGPPPVRCWIRETPWGPRRVCR